MNCVQKAFFIYGRHVVKNVRYLKPNSKGKLSNDQIPDLGVYNNICNLVNKFDKNWESEPKDNPNIWRATIKTLGNDIAWLHFFTFISATFQFARAYFAE